MPVLSFSFDWDLNIEPKTRNQAKSNKWYELRAGQVTASAMKEGCSTKVENPSL